MSEIDEDLIADVPVARLVNLINPLDPFIWCEEPTKGQSIGLIYKCLRMKHLLSAPVQDNCTSHRAFRRHCQRIAYLVLNKAEDPIEIDVGCPSLGFFNHHFICDGHHRLAAAIIRKDETIRASISGEVDYARELLHVPDLNRVKTPRARTQAQTAQARHLHTRIKIA